ncbi:MAG: Uncharacterized protein G01um101430_324 [Parcubacteria group bacterium Gr01-1014_30]|nr:MAG: Uncharacterized protein G01um101430_324 [Parcubacteria group bacterium Gr01-1014_30]
MKTAIVTTTINIPEALAGYAESAKQYGHRDVAFIIIGDLKTPQGAKDFCEKLAKESSLEVLFLDVESQKSYLKKYPELLDFLPYNSDKRRNIGFLLAYEQGAEKIITIDDDNFCLEGDFIGQHGIVGEIKSFDSIYSESGWFNVCSFLKEARGQAFFHRGYPVQKRVKEHKIEQSIAQGKVAANAGLWLGDPDVDAVTRIAISPEAVGYKRQDNFFLAKGTWSPFDSQNVAFAREVIPAYFLSHHIGRDSDIWASYIVRKITDHMGELVSYGRPLVKQLRNEHDLVSDLEQELDSMRLIDRFCEHLRNINLKGQSYKECFTVLVGKLGESFRQDESFSERDAVLLNNFCQGLRVWAETIDKVGS